MCGKDIGENLRNGSSQKKSNNNVHDYSLEPPPYTALRAPPACRALFLFKINPLTPTLSPLLRGEG